LQKLERDFASLETQLTESTTDVEYNTVLPVLEQMQDPLGYGWGIAGHLNGVKKGEELRQAYEQNQPKIVKAMSMFKQSKPLYDALSSIEQTWKTAAIDDDDFEKSQRRRAVENSLRGMTLGGVGLEGAEKERFNEIKMRLASLSTTYSNNVLDETTGEAYRSIGVSRVRSNCSCGPWFLQRATNHPYDRRHQIVDFAVLVIWKIHRGQALDHRWVRQCHCC
jgi:oligopeptidase A